MKGIPERIKKVMEEKGISYGELSTMTGITKSALYRYVNGQNKKYSTDRVEDIAKALNVDVKYLLGYTTDSRIDDLRDDIDDAKKYLATLTDEDETEEQNNAIDIMNESLDDMMLVRSLGWTGENKKSPVKAEAFRGDIQNLLSRSTDEQIQEIIRYWEYIISK